MKVKIILILMIFLLGSAVSAYTEFVIHLPGFYLTHEVTGSIGENSLDGYDSADLPFGNYGEENPYIAFTKKTGEDGWDGEDYFLEKDSRNANTAFPKIWRAKIWGPNCQVYPTDIVAWWRREEQLKITGRIFFDDQIVNLSFDLERISLPANAEGYDIIVEIAPIPEPSSLVGLLFGFGAFWLRRKINKHQAALRQPVFLYQIISSSL